ncbi:hypothetical protein JCM10207_008084 [Rhodosporidiobolus poonsookiae]
MPALVKKASIVTVGIALPDASLAQLREVADEVHYYPKGDAPADVLAKTQVYTCSRFGTPASISDMAKQMPNLVLLQLPSAGADKVVEHTVIKKALANGANFSVATASGVHAVSIPQYIVATLLALYLRLPQQILVSQNEARWAGGDEIAVGLENTGENDTAYYVRSLRGKTVGFLSYGHLARAAAALLPAFGVKIIAANSNGKRRTDEGYHIPGTGDKDAALPAEMYSTSDNASLDAFLSRCDVLVSSLPSTPSTRGFLTRERLARLPKDAVLINVGRGDVIASEDLVWACDRADGLWGAAIDVTEPEPLPAGHPLFKHPKIILTPHLSGDCQDELALGASIMCYNVERLNTGKDPINLVSFGKGY